MDLTMFTFCKTLQPGDYETFTEHRDVLALASTNIYRYEHEHRKWEYGLALKLAKQINPQSILNIGGGNSPLSSLLVREIKVPVTEIDPSNIGSTKFPGITYNFDSFPSSSIGVHEFIVCTSVIEHVPDDMEFITELLKYATKSVFLTMDFHPSGNKFFDAHLRTYNESNIGTIIKLAQNYNFSPIGELSYNYTTPMVYGYTFASLSLIKS